MRTFNSFIITLLASAVVSACTTQNTIPEPKIGELSISDVTVYSARISGSVIVPNTTDLLEFGIELSTDYQFDPLKTRKTEADAEEFSIAVKDLEADRRYYARTYYIDHNSSGNIYRYSKPVNFLTPSLETLIRTDDASDVDKTQATLNGYVNTTGCITEGNSEFGFKIGTSSTTIDGEVQYTDFDADGDKGCCFWADDDQLTENTRYYYQAYVTLDGTTYKGEVREFLTSDIQVDVTTGEATAVTQNKATLSGSLASDKYGQSYWFLYSGKCEKLEDLKISGTKAIANGNDSKFAVTLSGLTASTPYYYVACVRVDGIDFYGDVQSFTTEKEVTPTPPTPSKGWPGWFELPAVSDADGNRIDDNDPTLYYARHSFTMSGRQLRNYTVCFSSEHHCPVWVAAPRHSVYEGGSGRTDAYKADPDIPSNIQYNSKSTGGGCNKGHMLGSKERTCYTECNQQVFFYSNIAPQLNDGFNTGGGGWNLLEDWVDKQVCSDTLYVVIGCYFDKYTDGYGETVSPKTISFGGRSDVSFPTMFYYILLRTKNGSSRKALKDCSATELKCAAFVRSHTNAHKGQKPSSREMMSVADLEKITGFTYFPNVPNAPKSTYSASEWRL